MERIVTAAEMAALDRQCITDLEMPGLLLMENAGAGIARIALEMLGPGAGRPVLLVPEGRNHLRGKAVVFAWKDSREARRALTDALPLLQRAEDVMVTVVHGPDETVEEQQLADVVANLKRHGVRARALVTSARPDDVPDELQKVAKLRFNLEAMALSM